MLYADFFPPSLPSFQLNWQCGQKVKFKNQISFHIKILIIYYDICEQNIVLNKILDSINDMTKKDKMIMSDKEKHSIHDQKSIIKRTPSNYTKKSLGLTWAVPIRYYINIIPVPRHKGNKKPKPNKSHYIQDFEGD